MSTAPGIHAVSGENFSYSCAGSPKTGTSAWLTTEGHCCWPVSPVALGGFARLGGLGVELHPDGQLFFAKNFAGHEQKTLQAVAEQRLPEPADQVELFAERSGRADGGRAQQIEQAHRLGVGQSESADAWRNTPAIAP